MSAVDRIMRGEEERERYVRKFDKPKYVCKPCRLKAPGGDKSHNCPICGKTMKFIEVAA